MLTGNKFMLASEIKTWNDAARYELEFHDRNAMHASDFAIDSIRTRGPRLIEQAQRENLNQTGAEWRLGHYLISTGTLGCRALKDRGDWDIDQMVDLLCSKQHDYGPGNILAFGILGVAVRMSDKIERLNNLTRKISSDPTPRNESLLDTLFDIVGYAVVTGMLIANHFTLELADE